MYNGVVFNDGDVLDGSDKLKTMIDNDQYMKPIVDGIPRGLIASNADFFGGIAVNSNAAEATLASVDLFLAEERTLMVVAIVNAAEFIGATGSNYLKLRVYEDATQRNEFWGRIQTSTGDGDIVYEPKMYNKCILTELPVGNVNISLKGILNSAAPCGFQVYGMMYIYDIGKQIAGS